MLGPMKLSESRARIREASGLSDVERNSLFDKRIAESSEAVAESLRLFRDALVKEVKRKTRRPSGK
jgi:hypothetical protein